MPPPMHARETAPADAPQLRRFHALYRGEFAFVWSAALHLGVPAGTVDDVVQDVFLTAYRRLDQLHFEVSPRAWLFGVTRRVAFRYRRGAARRARRHTAFAELAQPAATAPQQRHDDAQLLARVLGQLGDGTRAVWEMTELLGMSAPEIAAELGLPLNTVYSRLRLARRQLQALVADDRLAAWSDAARGRQAPPREAESRTWGLLLPVLGKTGATAGLTAWVSSQTAAATTLVVASAAAVALVVARGPARASAPPEGAPVAIDAPHPSPTGAPPRPSPPAVAPAIAAPAPPPAPSMTAPKDMSRKPSSDLAGEPAAGLAEEVAAIDRVQSRLAASDPAGALLLIDAHARRFPAGTLADLREAARVEALCRRGEVEAAEAAARLLVRTYPDSSVAQRFADPDKARCAR